MMRLIKLLLVFLPLLGGGLLGFALGAGPLPVLGNLILHVVYGSVLGALYAPGSDSIVDSPSHRPTGDDVWAVPSAERGAARGMLFGLGLGVVFGTIGALLSSVTGAQGLGLNPLAIVVAIALTGAAFGAMAGSLSRAD